MALVLATVAQSVFIVGHEMVHRHSVRERRFGEFLLSSVSLPPLRHGAHLHPSCPGRNALDTVGSAPRGLSFWRYFPREVASNLVGAWRVQRNRLARAVTGRCGTARTRSGATSSRSLFWYALVLVDGGAGGRSRSSRSCVSGSSSSMKLEQLHRSTTGSGAFVSRAESSSGSSRGIPVSAPPARWTTGSFSTCSATRTITRRRAGAFRLMQHHGGELSPQLPGSYGKMFPLALMPRRWFRTMDPLVDEWRAHFYPGIDDWSAYDSPAFAARPERVRGDRRDSRRRPRASGAWINRSPELLDNLENREFADLDLPRRHSGRIRSSAQLPAAVSRSCTGPTSSASCK